MLLPSLILPGWSVSAGKKISAEKSTNNFLTNGNDSAIVTPINQLETCDRDEYLSRTVSKASCGWCEHSGTGEKEWTREGKPSAITALGETEADRYSS